MTQRQLADEVHRQKSKHKRAKSTPSEVRVARRPAKLCRSLDSGAAGDARQFSRVCSSCAGHATHFCDQCLSSLCKRCLRKNKQGEFCAQCSRGGR